MRLTPTERVLRRMFTEFTGIHLCDSGGVYGRNFERNRRRPPWTRPEITAVEMHGGPGSETGIQIQFNTYKWLLDKVEYAPELQQAFRAFRRRGPQRDAPHLASMADFAEQQAGEAQTTNTYNHDSLLDQTLQWVEQQHPHGFRVLLQVHGGCDVRGGYTAPKAFFTDGLDDRTGTIGCAACGAFWRTDDAWTYYTVQEDYRELRLPALTLPGLETAAAPRGKLLRTLNAYSLLEVGDLPPGPLADLVREYQALCRAYPEPRTPEPAPIPVTAATRKEELLSRIFAPRGQPEGILAVHPEEARYACPLCGGALVVGW